MNHIYVWGLRRLPGLKISLTVTGDRLNQGLLLVEGPEPAKTYVQRAITYGRDRYGHTIGKRPCADQLQDLLNTSSPYGLKGRLPFRARPTKVVQPSLIVNPEIKT